MKNRADAYLKKEILAVVIGQRLRRLDNLMQIRVHELGDQVDILEAPPMYRHHYILQGNDILMAQVPKELQLAQRPQRIHAVVKDVVYLLDGDLLVGLLVDRGANYPVGSSSDGLDRHVLGVDLKHRLVHRVVMLPMVLLAIQRSYHLRHFLFLFRL